MGNVNLNDYDLSPKMKRVLAKGFRNHGDLRNCWKQTGEALFRRKLVARVTRYVETPRGLSYSSVAYELYGPKSWEIARQCADERATLVRRETELA